VNWQYWIAVSKYDWRDGLIYVDESTHDIHLTKRLWALGNFSRFLRPGAVRIEAASSDDLLRTSAYRQDGKLIVVLANLRSIPQNLTLALKKDADQFTTMQAFETSAEYDLAQVFDGDFSSSLSIAPHSVTTLVFSGE
jgi:O-glycosyl hydrolase